MQITQDSRLSDIYKHPVGKDVINKILLQLGVSDWVINNPIIGRLSLKTCNRLVKKAVGPDLINALINLLNNEPDVPRDDHASVTRAWWKEAVFYQIYPRSFKDSDGDGIGDIQGVISKLDYLKELGIDAIWLCPVYDSPNDDNGYDIRDYYAINPEFGDMKTFDCLLTEAHSRGIKLIMDLVVNHTSDEHQWFKMALSGDEAYQSYYLCLKNGGLPNNWTSYFSGPAWKYHQDADFWSLHLFSNKQMDLNWESESMRGEIYKMIRFWLDKGVDGFRLDVINYISKTPGIPQGNEFIGKLMGYTGIEHYFYGPKLHEHLSEMRREAFEPYDAFSVGETPGLGVQMIRLLTDDYRKELDMAFSFDILETPGHSRFDEYVYDPVYLKKYFTDWQEQISVRSWMALFYNNHDNPRMISKIDPEAKYRVELAKMLAVIQFTLRGTPFIFQGDELGAINRAFSGIDDLRDVESLNLFAELKEKMGPEAAFRKVLAGSRDHARVPMQWDNSTNSGFTEGSPWIEPTYDDYHAENQMQDINSVWSFYKKLIELRKNREALIYGDINFDKKMGSRIFAYSRKTGSEEYYILINLCGHNVYKPVKKGFRILLSNYEKPTELLRPYEANIYIHL